MIIGRDAPMVSYPKLMTSPSSVLEVIITLVVVCCGKETRTGKAAPDAAEHMLREGVLLGATLKM
jgi:hypothetical protein